MIVDSAQLISFTDRFQLLRSTTRSVCLLSGLVVQDSSSPVLVRARHSPIGIRFFFASARVAVQFRLDNSCLDRIPTETEHRLDRSSVMPISNLVLLDAALRLIFVLYRGFVLCLPTGCFPSFFAGIMPGLLDTVIHLLGLTWA